MSKSSKSNFYNIAIKYLSGNFEESDPLSFYKDLFPVEDIQEPDKPGSKGNYKYCPIAIEEVPNGTDSKGEPVTKFVRHHIYSDYAELKSLLNSENFVTLNPITYIGRQRTADNARYMYALTFDLDGSTEEADLIDLFHQADIKHIPRPTYVAVSGQGLHLYYFFERPLACFGSIIFQLTSLKGALTRKLWNQYLTRLSKPEEIQYQPPLQPFRMVGSPCKDYEKTKHRVRAFKTGERTTIEQLNEFVPKMNKMVTVNYLSRLTLEEAEKKYPNWFRNRITLGFPKGQWTTKRDLYDWWLREIKEKAKDGHRYWDVMLLASYARKAGITFEELKQDAYSLVEPFDAITERPENPFVRSDVTKAIKAYKRPKTVYMTIDAIEHYSAIRIEKNKRNFRRRDAHLKLARYVRDEINGRKETWREGNGRKPQQQTVEDWQAKHPNGKKSDCIRETGLSKPTVYKWWK